MNIPAGCSVRLAQPGDAAQVAALLAELGYPGNPAAEVRRRLAMWERETAGLALVAERQGQVAGVIAVAAIPYLERGGRWGRIVALVVSSACRGQGIGRLLAEAAEKAAGELGCVTMEVTSRRSRTESHPFYRNLGYEDCCDRSARYLKALPWQGPAQPDHDAVPDRVAGNGQDPRGCTSPASYAATAA